MRFRLKKIICEAEEIQTRFEKSKLWKSKLSLNLNLRSKSKSKISEI